MDMGRLFRLPGGTFAPNQFEQDCLPGMRSMRMKVGLSAVVAIAVMLALGIWSGASSQVSMVSVSKGSSLFRPDIRPFTIAKAFVPDRADLEPITARKLNAAIPFAEGAMVAARPFLFLGDAADRERAVDCLAIAAMAEAGEGDDGQRAVMQVVLNRVRHPAFPKSVCGVVFEGSHRSTGCQFTFTCDGALARRYSHTAWSRARIRAIEALNGRVHSTVGLATHYHTDWVHPYWSPKLIKLARVDTHLFFRWPGNWGSRTAFRVTYGGAEPTISALAYLAAHAGIPSALPLAPLVSVPQDDPASIDIVVRNEDGGAFVLLSGVPSAERARDIARGVCVERSSCKVFGWFDRASIPTGYPVPSNLRAKLGFSYFRGLREEEIVLYDCSRFASIATEKCLPLTNRVRVTARTNSHVRDNVETRSLI